MFRIARPLLRTALLGAVAVLVAGAPAPFATADGDDVSEMCFVTNGEDAPVHRIDTHADPSGWVGGTLTGDTHRYWLKFDLSALPAGAGDIVSATLDLTAGRKSVLEIGVALAEDDWSAASIDWDSQPVYLPATNEELYTFAASTHYTWDVTNHVVFDMAGGDRTLSLMLMQVPEGFRTGNVWFHTDTGAPVDSFRPRLCIQYREQTNTPPTIEAGEPVCLWPPNNKMNAFSLSDLASASDDEDGAIDLDAAGRILSVTSNEDIGGKKPDVVIVDDANLEVRAERDGKGDGRTYTVVFEVTDAGGLTTQGEATICVPHDQGK